MRTEPRAGHRRSGRRGAGIAVAVAPWVMFVVAAGGGCPRAGTANTRGGEAGTACREDLACAAGLVCACGVCAAPDGTETPPSCDVPVPVRCEGAAPVCWASCDDPTPVAAAVCVMGTYQCTVAGIQPATCGGSTACSGAPARGEICVDGDWVCARGRSPAFGACYTDDCPIPVDLCRETCAEEATHAARCVAGEYRCETGIPAASCPACAGDAPDCLASCIDPRPVASAYCDAALSDYSCDHVLGTVRADECLAPDAGLGDAGAGDGGTGDTGARDGGAGDAGTGDVGTGDAGAGDAGTGDAGTGDAGAGDGGAGDAGTRDAGLGPSPG